MKRKVLVKETDIDTSDVYVSLEEIEGDPEDFLKRKGFIDFSWSYIEFGEKKRIKI